MRFAVSLLTVLSIASIIGTVLVQNQPYPNYMIEFGNFYFKLYELLGLFDVYHSSWFLVILVFLVLSTSLCIYRHTPNFIREMKTFKENLTYESLMQFQHRATFAVNGTHFVNPIQDYLVKNNYKVSCKAQKNGETLIAAKLGIYQKLGYIFTHVAIVIICIGGLMDGNVPLKIQELLGLKKAETRDLTASQVGALSRLSPSNLSFRGNISIPENSSVDVVFLNAGDGYFVQDLPFAVGLKKFHIEHYNTGQPKSFASDVIIFDKETKKSFEATIKVNHPLTYKGVSIYQASFEDGGTKLKLNSWSLFSPIEKPFAVAGQVKKNTELSNGEQDYTIEFTDFRPFNVERTGQEKQKVRDKLSGAMGSGAASQDEKSLHNVGPSFMYKVRDKQGQAHEYHNYMLPVQIENRWYFMSGMRGAPNENFRYVYFPLLDGSFDDFNRLRAILFNKKAYPDIGKRFTDFALKQEENPTLKQQFQESTEKILSLYATGGMDAVARFINKIVPEAQRTEVAQTYMKMLEGLAFQALQLSREQAKLPALDPNKPETLFFVRDTLNAISDSFFYGSPVYLQLVQYDQVQATGLQMTRSPGKNIVYLGSVLLILGVFVMLYMREQRVWFYLKENECLFAMSANRKNYQFETSFKMQQQALSELLGIMPTVDTEKNA